MGGIQPKWNALFNGITFNGVSFPFSLPAMCNKQSGELLISCIFQKDLDHLDVGEMSLCLFVIRVGTFI